MAGTAYIEHDPDPDAEKGWINLHYPQYNARIHLSYKTIKEDTSLTHYLDDCHHMAYTHTIKAESIHEKYFRNRPYSVLSTTSKEILLHQPSFL